MTITLIIRHVRWIFILVSIIVGFLLRSPCAALEPHQILVIANKNTAASVELAQFYMKMRNIPESNLLQLSTTNKEWCSREEYEEKKELEEQMRKEKDEYGKRLKDDMSRELERSRKQIQSEIWRRQSCRSCLR